MGDKLDKELRAKFKAGYTHAQQNTEPMTQHGSKAHASAYDQGFRFGKSTLSPEQVAHFTSHDPYYESPKKNIGGKE